MVLKLQSNKDMCVCIPAGSKVKIVKRQEIIQQSTRVLQENGRGTEDKLRSQDGNICTYATRTMLKCDNCFKSHNKHPRLVEAQQWVEVKIQ